MITRKIIIITYFILIILAYIPDLITTIWSLSLGAVEINPIANYLFSVGNVSGVFLVLFFTFFISLILLGIVELVYLVYRKWFKEDLRFYGILLAVILIIIFWRELEIVINNINLISELKGG